MNPRNMILAAVLCGAVVGSGAFAAEGREDAVLARVGGEPVTSADLDAVLAGLGKPGPDAASNQALSPEAVLRRLIQNRLLEQEGYRMGADRKPEVKNQVTDLIQYRSMEALLDSLQGEVPGLEPGDMDSVLDQTHTMHRLSHILVATSDEAQALLDSLNAGVVFADLADRHSLDKTWAGAGGDLGWAGEGRFIPEFEELLPGMEVGDVAGPVKTAEGWDLITLTEVHTETVGQSGAMKNAIRDVRMRQRVMSFMEAYLSSLKEKYGVVVNEALLACLDYASSDPAIQAELRTSEAVLAELPGRNLTVKGLTFKIRFKYFHGTEGKENADQIRDEMFHDWLAESLFRYEAWALGFQKKPAIVAAADRLERRLLREAVLGSVADVDIEVSPEDVEAFYREHTDEFTRSMRIKADGVLLSEEAAAREFRENLEKGTSVKWLADRSSGVMDARPAVFQDWLDPKTLGVPGGAIEPGTVLGPAMIGGGWAVAKVVQVEPPRPIPLERCRSLVAKKLRAEKRHDAVSRALALLESQTTIEIESGAQGVIRGHLDRWLSGGSPDTLE